MRAHAVTISFWEGGERFWWKSCLRETKYWDGCRGLKMERQDLGAPRSDALKVLLDFAPRESQHHRPAVRADRGVRRSPQFLQDVRHLFHGQCVVRLDCRVARHGRGDSFQYFLNLRAAIEPVEVLSESAQGELAVLAREQRRKCRNAQRRAAEFLHLETEAFEFGGMTDKRLAPRSRQVNEHRLQQTLALQPAPRQLL